MTVDDVFKAARVAEAAFRATAKTPMEATIDRVVAELAAEQNTLELWKFTSQLSKKTVDQVIHVGKVASVHEVLQVKPEVSEQFLNGTSAQYRLYSAIQIKS